jgi:hypothetical protein
MNGMQPSIKTEMVFVTPEMAKQFLEKNDINRNVIKSHVNEIAQAILDGDWKPHHQGIAFSESGSLLDGQHRLLAVEKANSGVWMQVNRDVPPESFFYIDVCKQRTLVFRSGLTKSQTEVAAFLLRTTNSDVGGSVRKKDVVTVAKALQQPIYLLQQIAPTRAAIVSSAAVRAACIVAMLRSANPEFALKTYRSLTLGNVADLPPIGHAVVKQLLAKKISKSGGGSAQKAHYLKFRFVLDVENQYRTKLALEQPEGNFINEAKQVIGDILSGKTITSITILPTIADFA